MQTKILLILCININLITFAAFVVDKIKARSGAWRISEATLLGLCLLGGSLGGLIAMYLVRHKTRHLKFSLGIPLIIFIQIVFGYSFLYK